jgi:hypothetical protein
MPDPPVVCFWKWIGWKDYEVPKNRNLESVSTKNVMFFSPTPRIPTPNNRFGPTQIRIGEKPSWTRRPSLGSPRCSTSSSPAAVTLSSRSSMLGWVHRIYHLLRCIWRRRWWPAAPPPCAVAGAVSAFDLCSLYPHCLILSISVSNTTPLGAIAVDPHMSNACLTVATVGYALEEEDSGNQRGDHPVRVVPPRRVPASVYSHGKARQHGVPVMLPKTMARRSWNRGRAAVPWGSSAARPGWSVPRRPPHGPTWMAP